VSEKFSGFNNQLISATRPISAITDSAFRTPHSELTFAPHPALMFFAQPTSANAAPFDFDGDGKSDISRWRGSTGEWSVIKSGDGNFQLQTLGSQTDLIAAEDYDGDNKTDYAVFNSSSGVWTIHQSSDSTNVTHIGTVG
jgi:hypothetical protein